MRKLTILTFIILMIFSGSSNFAEEVKSSEPEVLDYCILAGTGLTALALELGKNYIGPHTPRLTDPGLMDSSMRSFFVWDTSSLGAASVSSDITLLLLVSQVAWVPFAIQVPYLNGAVVLGESLLSTWLISSLVKIISGRERPYAYYGTKPDKGVDDNYSFLSGHASISFAAATTGSLMLSEKFPKLKPLIFTISFLLAGATAYFRMAGDQHYFTDVLAGAVLGAGMGFITYTWRKPLLEIQPVAGGVMIQKTMHF